MSTPVSLALPVYNGANFLAEALESLLCQTFPDFEIIVTDNASTDSTPDICQTFAERDSRIRYQRMPRNIGAGPNFNWAFRLGRGEFFKWCAHDDLISPDYVERCVAMLESRPDAVLAFGRTIRIDENGEESKLRERGLMPPLEHDDPIVRFRTAIRHSGSCFPVFGLFRANALKRSMLHSPYYGSDRALLAEIALLGKSVLVEEAVFYNRDHGARSVRMRDKAERRRWHNTSTARLRSLEHVNFVRNLVKIARRHDDVASPSVLLREVAKATLTPWYLGRCSRDLVQLVSPSAGEKLTSAWKAVFRSSRRIHQQ